MTRLFSLILATVLIASPGIAGGLMFDLPNLTFPQTAGPVTPSTSGPSISAPALPHD